MEIKYKEPGRVEFCMGILRSNMKQESTLKEYTSMEQENKGLFGSKIKLSIPGDFKKIYLMAMEP